MKIREYSHRCGAEIVPADMKKQIRDVLCGITLPIVKGRVPQIRHDIIHRLQQEGWSNEVRLDPSSNITITGMRGRVGLCVQLGNVSRTYADLMKLQTLFLRGSLDAGIILLPGYTASHIFGPSIADGDRLERELKIFAAVISMPLWVVSFDVDGADDE